MPSLPMTAFGLFYFFLAQDAMAVTVAVAVAVAVTPFELKATKQG